VGRAVLAAFTWDFGRSISTRQPIRGELPLYFRGTVELGFIAFVVAVCFGILAGILAAVKQDSFADHILRVVTLGGVAAPLFWITLMAQVLFYGSLNWFPAEGQLSDDVKVVSPLRRVSGFNLFDAVWAQN